MRKTIAAISLLMLSMVSNSFASEKVITLINPFEVPENMLEESIAFWEQARDFLQTQPGYISTDLHQSIIGDARFVLINVAKWESAEAFMAASALVAGSNVDEEFIGTLWHSGYIGSLDERSVNIGSLCFRRHSLRHGECASKANTIASTCASGFSHISSYTLSYCLVVEI